MLHAPTILQLLLIMFYCTNGTQAAYIILLNDTYWLLNNFRDDVLVCQIYKYIGTCINMVITCQIVEFGRATTVLGITMLCKLLTGELGC